MEYSTVKTTFSIKPSTRPVDVKVIINFPQPGERDGIHCDVVLTSGPDSTPDLMETGVIVTKTVRG